jgi:hypothetical protein
MLRRLGFRGTGEAVFGSCSAGSTENQTVPLRSEFFKYFPLCAFQPGRTSLGCGSRGQLGVWGTERIVEVRVCAALPVLTVRTGGADLHSWATYELGQAKEDSP